MITGMAIKSLTKGDVREEEGFARAVAQGTARGTDGDTLLP